MKLSDLTPNEENPRAVTPAKLSQLKRALAKFGDLSGFVFNRKTGHLVGGHQRRAALDSDASVTITRKFSKPTRTGTIAEGYIEIGTDRFSYREVYWEPAVEKAANIAANKSAGEWDLPQLSNWIKDLKQVEFDLTLTMFDDDELMKLPTPIEVSGHTRTSTTKGKDKPEKETTPVRVKLGQVWICGDARVKIGSDTQFWDAVISKWEKYSGETAIVAKADVKTKAVKHPTKQPHGNA